MFVNRVRALVAGIVCGLTSMVTAQVPVGTAFTYQGELRQQGAVVTSTADMRFRLYDAATGGNQIGPELQLLSGTVSKGHFTVELDFGATAFGPNARWLEVVLRTPAGPGTSYTTLTPRQRITPAPVALYALSGNAGAAGPTGPVGPQGLQGPPGVQGQTGSQGVAGPGGPAGPAGPQGAMGPTGLTGSQGSTGAAGLSWRGIWSPQSNYALNDAILDNGSSYRCIAAPNVGNPPATSPGLWQLVASVGSPGATGSTGPVGAQGSTGPQGLPGQPGVPGVPGTQGPQGEPGNTGPTGTGQQGPPGISGATGATGVAGPTGASFTQFVVGQDPADPYQTVQSAVAAAQLAGGPQMVYVKPGLYQENIDITGPDITLRGSGVSSTVVLGTLRVSPSPNSAGKRVSKIDSFTIKTSVQNGVTVTSSGPVDVSFSDFTVDTAGPVVTSMLVDCPQGGSVSYRKCTCPAGFYVTGASLSVDAVDSRFSSVQCESSRLRLSNCLITSVTVPCLSLSSGAQCECVSSWMGRSSGTATPDCAVVSSGSSLTCRSCVTVGRFACDASSLRLESCDSSNPTGVCCDLSSGGTCVATSSRLSGGGGGAGGSVCVSVSSSSSMTCTGCECTGQFDCVGGALHLASSSFRDEDSDDDGVLDIRSGGTCDVVSCVIDSGRATGGRVAVACDGALSGLEMSGCVSYGALECSAIISRNILKSYFETGDRPTVAQRSGAVLKLSDCTLVRSPGALTNGVCMSIDGQDTDTDCSSCQVSGSVSVTGGSRVSFHSSSITTLSMPCLSEVSSAAELDFCTLSSGGAPTDGRCVVASGGHVSLSRCELYGGEQCDDGATVTNDACTIRCVASPCVTVSSTSHALLHSGAMLTSSSPAVSSAQGGDVRFGVVTYLGSGGGMPPTAVALPVENVAQLVTVQVQQFSGPVSMTNPSNVFGGSGAALSSLSASALSSGTVPDARLSSSVVRTNAPNVFSLDQTFTQVLHAQGGVEFSDGSVQQTAARPPLSRFTVGKDPGDAFTSVQAAVTAAEAAGGPQVVVLKPGTFAGDVTITSPDITLWGVSAHGSTPSTILGQLRLSTSMSVGKPMLTWCVRVQVTDNRPAVVMDGPSPLFVEMRDVVVSSSAPVTGPLMVVSPSSSTGTGGSGRVSMSRCTVDGRLYMAGGAELSFVGVDDDCDSFTCEGGSLHLSSSRLSCSSGVCVDALSGAVVSLDSCRLRGTSGGVGALTQVVRLDASSSVSCDSCDCTGELLCVGGSLRLTGGTYNDPDTDGDSLVTVTQGGRVTAISACFKDAAGNTSPVFRVSSGSTCSMSCCPTCRIDNSPTNRPVVLCDGAGSSCEISSSPCVGSLVCTSGGQCVARSSSFVTLDAPALQVTSARCRASDCRFSSSPTGALTDAVCFSLQGQETDVDCGGCTIDGRVVVSGGVVLTPRLRLSTCSVRSLSLPCLAVSGGDEDCDGCAFTVGSGSPTDAMCVSATGGASLHLSSCLVVGSEECDDGNLVNDDCLMRCVSAPCVSVGASGHAAVRTCTLQTSASPLVAIVQGGELRYGLVTSGGSGSGMPPGAVALVIQNLPMLTTPDLQSFSGPLAMTNPSNVLGGNGAALTNLDASHITTGVLDDSHFPSSVVRTTAPNIFSAENSFTQAVHAEGGVAFSDGSLQTTAARPPLSRFTVGKDPGDAFSSIQAAVSAAELAGGGTVFVKPGVYTEDVTITKSNIVVSSASSRDGRSYVAGHFHIEVDGVSGGYLSSRVVVQGLEIAPVSGPAMVLAGQSLCEVVVSDCKLTCASGTCMSVDLQGVDTSGRHTPFHVSRCDVSSASGQAPALALLSGEGRLDECRVSCPVDGVAMSCALGAVTKQYVDSCDFSGRVQCTGSGACVMTRCSVSLSASSQTDSVALSLSGSCDMSCRDCTVSGGRVDSSGSSRLYMSGGKVLVAGGLDAVRLTVQARDRFDNVQMSGRLFVTDSSTCDLSRCALSVSSGAGASCDASCRVTFHECFLTARLECSGSCECDVRASTISVPSGDCVLASASSKLNLSGGTMTGSLRVSGSSSCDASSCSISNPGGDCVVSSNQGTVRFSGTDFEGRVHVTDSVSFSFQKCEFSNGQLSCMLADEDCDGVCSDCTFRGSVTSVGRKQKQWLCSNFRFSGDCLTIGEECDDQCSTCTFDGRVLLSGTAHSSFTDCAFSSTGQCVSSLDHHQSSFTSCRKSGELKAADFSRTTLQACTFTSSLQCLELSGSSDCVCSGTTFSGPVSLGGQSTSRLTDNHMLLGLHLFESAQAECFSDTIDSALNLQDDGIASFRSCHIRSSSGSCIVMTGAPSLTIVQSQLDSPPGALAIQAPPAASVRVAQLVLSSSSLMPPQTTSATVVDPIDSSRLVDGSVGTLDLALSSVDSSRLAVDSSSLSRVSGGSLQASSTPAGSSIVLSSSSLFLFGGQDVSLYRGGSSLLHLDGALESSLGLQALGGDVVVHSGRVLASDGAVLGGGGGGGGGTGGGSARISSVGDLDMDGSLDVAVGALHVSSSLHRVGINELLPDAKLHVTGTALERAAHFSSSSSTQSALISEVTIPAAQVSAIEGVSHSPLLEGAAIRGRNDSPVGQSVGVLGESHSQQGFGVFSIGNTGATGLKSFYIDHPLDPANKFLRHYSAEGPEALNIYRGTVVLNAAGEAVVSLPDYFEALNKDFDYQLTCVGGFAPVFIAEEVRNNAFKISGGRAGLKVCWTVTGVRNDAFAKSSTPPVEEAKPASLRGKYLHPELFNAAPDKAIFLNVESAAGGLAQTRKN